MKATAQRRRGRSAKKRDAIVAAAATCFVDKGYAAASMDSIAAAAGVSKQTVYHHFGDKHALFDAAVRHLTDDISRTLLEESARRRGPEETLAALGLHILELTLRPQTLAFLRLIIAEAPKFRGLADVLVKSGMDPLLATVARYLEDETARGRLAVDEPRRAALMFLGMLAVEHRFRALLGVLPEVTLAERETHVKSVVAAFLRAYGAPRRR